VNNSTEPFLEQYRSLREEIHIRVRQHYQLVSFKVLALGGLLSFFANLAAGPRSESRSLTSPAEPFLVWVIPAVAVVFDTLIAGNIRAIRNLGVHIKDYVEPVFREAAPTSRWWEGTVASSSPRNHCFTITDVLFIWSFTAGSILLIYAGRIHRFEAGDWIGLLTVAIGSVAALALMIRSLTRERHFGG